MRILVLSASVGAGHVRAAEAVELALKQLVPEPTIANYDVLTLMPPPFRKVYSDGYLNMVARTPRILGWLYDATDKPFHQDRLQRQIERAGAVKLLKRIREFDPDVVICTHFLPTALLDRERRKGRTRARILTVVTDFEVHGMWLSVASDHYFVATAEARAHLESLGIPAQAITVSGIPTHPVTAEKKDRALMRRKHGLREDLPAILVSAGGFGAGNGARMIETLIQAKIPAQIIAICGKNPALKSSLEKLARANKNSLPVVKVVGFTTEMDEFMTAADLMIGKPGGLTTSESLIKGLAWVVVNPIPGQEEKNAIYLLEQGVGIWSDNLHTLGYKVGALLAEPQRLEAMRKNALRVARPDAGRLIAEHAHPPMSILSWIGRHELAVLLAFVGLATGVLAFTAIADEVVEGKTQSFDRRLLLAMRHKSDLSPIGSPEVQDAARDITALGGGTVLTMLTLFTGGYLFFDGRKHLALFVWGSIGSGILLSTILKTLYQRPRPDLVPHGAYVSTASFPSGHSMLSAITYLTLGALLARAHARKRLKAYFLLIAALLTILIGVSRVYLGVHWPTDVLAGWTAGGTWAILCWLIARKLQASHTIEPELDD